ncbi:class I SAM-dependent methyltransferase [Anditalea andensis]|uniref:Methyltransferase type 11 n=1 Tax=Anditalea andensis TaxID=1048983 RepID=A0A074LLP3_9BACT|nr:class I SAM-dependent methyltransferase [Anditalea andensis]KEO74782.1 methyltransferase type 11 [Anditalea andensis]
MATYTTEIASDKLISDNPIHQRLLKAYMGAISQVKGHLLEIGCGEGRGIEVLQDQIKSYHGIDQHHELIHMLQEKYPSYTFEQANIPPLASIKSNEYDSVVSFQVIEHIENDLLFLKELYRVLKPGGKAIISTPNIKHTLTRNPWHIREYTSQQLTELCQRVFDHVETKGIGGNDKVWTYHEANRASVRRITKFDIFGLQYKLPASLLKRPYEFLNRRNRNQLHKQQGDAVATLSHKDYKIVDNPEVALDLYYVLHKKE